MDNPLEEFFVHLAKHYCTEQQEFADLYKHLDALAQEYDDRELSCLLSAVQVDIG
tara:strand:- start:1292 stop:1456 length:165 start_codon:yes stop_codon:yes gene_type:complete